MSLPTPTKVREYLEGYGIDVAVISDPWIIDTRDDEIVPLVERGTALSLTGKKEVTEFYSGAGSTRLILDRAPIIDLIDFAYTNSFDSNITLNSIDVDREQGILISKNSLENSTATQRLLFAKGNNNIKITYTYGFADANIPREVVRAILLLLASAVLLQIANRCGGGDLNIKELSRHYGELGEYGKIREQISNTARSLLDPYNSGVVGA